MIPAFETLGEDGPVLRTRKQASASAGQSNPSRYDVHDAEAFDLRFLDGFKFDLESQTVADLTIAENAVWDLGQRECFAPQESYADAMLNIEAMASVRMDGRPPSARDIFFELARLSLGNSDAADHVVRYKRDRASLVYAQQQAVEPASTQMLFELHGRVLPPRNMEKAGLLRDSLQHIGGSRYHTFGSAYTMPPPENIQPLLEDLVAFMNDEGLPVVEQAGIAHAQLINIHPFERGNGKMARAAVHFIMRYRGITPRYLLPITPVIVTSSHDYVAGINACKFNGSEAQETVNANENAWLRYFSTCCLKAADGAASFIGTCEQALKHVFDSVPLRNGSAAQSIVKSIPAMPVFSVRMMADYAGCSFKRASEGCKLLESAGVLQLQSQVKRNRIYFSPEVLNAYMSIDALR